MAVRCRWWWMVAAAAGCVQHPRYGGPMPVRNQHPVQLTVMNLDPAPATTLPTGRTAVHVDAAYSSYFLSGSGNGASYTMDGELLRAGLKARVGVGGGGEVGFELPVAHASGGFLDQFVIDYHDWLGFPDQGRAAAPRDAFDVAAARGSDTVYRLDSEPIELLDVPLSFTQSLCASGPDHPGVAVRGGVELPTGDQDEGFGNGGIDAAVGLLLEWPTRVAEFTMFAQHTFAATPSRARANGLQYGDVTAIGGGVELPLSERISALAQVGWETSALRELGFSAVARDQVLLWVGGRVQAGEQVGLEVSIGEDLTPYVAPDFTVWIGLSLVPRRASSW